MLNLERVGEFYYVNKEEYEDLDACLKEVSENRDVDLDFLQENKTEVHFHAAFLEYNFTKDMAGVYESLNKEEQTVEDTVESYNLNGDLFRKLIGE